MDYQAFRECGKLVFRDNFLRDMYTRKLAKALAEWNVIVATIPEDWKFRDESYTDPVNFDLSVAHNILSKCRSDDFWDPLWKK